MEVLFSFTFSDGLIYEVKNTLLPKDAPRDQRFQWIIYYFVDGKTELLEFKSMTPTTRSFQNGTFLDLDKMELTRDDKTFKLKVFE